MKTINLQELSAKSSKSEVELAKAIVSILAVKAKVLGVPQKIRFVVKRDASGQ